VRQALEAGVVAGYPVVDLRVVVYDGKHHSVDSKEIAFIQAGRASPFATGSPMFSQIIGTPRRTISFAISTISRIS